MKGTKKPPMATIKDFFPELTRRRTSVSRPTWNRSKIIPISANNFKTSLGSSQPSKLGPRMMPANNSPITEGILKRTAISENIRAFKSMIRR